MLDDVRVEINSIVGMNLLGILVDPLRQMAQRHAKSMVAMKKYPWFKGSGFRDVYTHFNMIV